MYLYQWLLENQPAKCYKIKCRFNTFRIKSIYHSQIEKKSYMVPYGDRYIGVAAKEHNKKRCLEVKDDDRLRCFISNLKSYT